MNWPNFFRQVAWVLVVVVLWQLGMNWLDGAFLELESASHNHHVAQLVQFHRSR